MVKVRPEGALAIQECHLVLIGGKKPTGLASVLAPLLDPGSLNVLERSGEPTATTKKHINPISGP